MALAATAVHAMTVVIEREPNNTLASAQAVDPNKLPLVQGTMASTSDVDVYRVGYIPGGECIAATLAPNPSGDYNLALVDKNNRTIASSRNGVGQMDPVTSCTVQGPVYLRVTYASGPVGPAGTYSLEISY